MNCEAIFSASRYSKTGPNVQYAYQLNAPRYYLEEDYFLGKDSIPVFACFDLKIHQYWLLNGHCFQLSHLVHVHMYVENVPAPLEKKKKKMRQKI